MKYIRLHTCRVSTVKGAISAIIAEIDPSVLFPDRIENRADRDGTPWYYTFSLYNSNIQTKFVNLFIMLYHGGYTLHDTHEYIFTSWGIWTLL